MNIEIADQAYLAGVIDARGRLTTRRAGPSILPVISVDMKPPAGLVDRLCELTGVAPIVFRRDYSRSNCEKHCPEPHNHIHGEYRRWLLVGRRATIVLSSVKPFLYLQKDAAEALIALDPPFKPSTDRKMKELGWPV